MYSIFGWLGTGNDSAGDTILFFGGFVMVIALCIFIIVSFSRFALRSAKAVKNEKKWYVKLFAFVVFIISAYIVGMVAFTIT